VIEALAGRYGVAASSVLAYESEPRPAIMGLCALIDRLLGEVDALEVPSVSV
jgi:hypothetical protein